MFEKQTYVKIAALCNYSTRFMDPTSGNDPKAELDKALFQQMQNLANKRRIITKEKVICSSFFHIANALRLQQVINFVDWLKKAVKLLDRDYDYQRFRLDKSGALFLKNK
jgi:hypothetical protein